MKSSALISKERLPRLNRRQRKKLHVGEFQELGFHLSIALSDPLDKSIWDAWWDEVIDRIESLGLAVGGLRGSIPLMETDAFVVCHRRGSVSHEQRVALLTWLRDRSEIAKVDVSDLVDAWYGWDEA
jgi:uncharacterized protein YggL (DUF469 family)